MRRILLSLICFSWMGLTPAAAESDPSTLAPPRSALGGGIGYMGVVHIDYQRWVAERTSIEVGLTPLLVHNVVAVGVTQHIRLAPAATTSDTSLVLTGMWMHIVNMGGSPAAQAPALAWSTSGRSWGSAWRQDRPLP